jgi:tRNA-2-methylthio-N6-dimethylallyladenosine synthase
MVGFPGETQEDFEATVDLVKKARYKNCFIFRYSPRPGTAADGKLQDDIPQDVKKSRNMELLTVQEKTSGELSKQFLGKSVTVLVEGLSKKPHLDAAAGDYPPSLKLRRTSPQLVGRTATDWIVVFNGAENLAGQFVTVKITKTSPLTLFGELG